MNSDDKKRFDKLYELLGDEVNQIFVDKQEEVFTDTSSVFTTNKSEDNIQKEEVVFNEIKPVSIEVPKDDKSNQVNLEDHNNIVRNITMITKKDYEDDFTEDTNYKRTITDILTNKKFIKIVSIAAFICVCIVVGKAFYFGKKNKVYEESFTEITEKMDDYVSVYEGEEIDTEVLKDVAASELVSCINQKIEIDKLPDSVNSVINEINNYYNSSYDYFAFVYKDIYTGFTVSYNANQNIFTASAIKAPTDIYIWETASQGKIDLDEEMTYTAGYINNGSGLLKNEPVNTKYTVRKLLEYSTVHSDNAAHNMLMDRFGRENMLSFWREKGTTAIFTANNNWGILNGNDSAIYMTELYNFYVSNKDYGEPAMTNFLNSYPKFIKGKNGEKTASKSGWSGTTLHDVAIVFADNPYVVVGLSNLGTSGYYQSYFDTISDMAARLHTEYWKYKMSVCNNIKQY